MNIRLATLDDIPAFVEIGRRSLEFTRFRTYTYNPNRVADQLRSVIHVGQNEKGSHCLLVAEDSQGLPVGGLIGCMERHIFSDQPVATVISYVVLPEKRMGGAGMRLLVAFRKWAENRGAVELNAGVNSGVEVEKMGRFLQRLGVQKTGGNYSLPLSPRQSISLN